MIRLLTKLASLLIAALLFLLAAAVLSHVGLLGSLTIGGAALAIGWSALN